jgi:hypothetical protein
MKTPYKILALFFVITIPIFLMVVVWQSMRYTIVDNDVTRLEKDQETWVNGSKWLIAGNNSLLSRERLEQLAKNMNLKKYLPEHIIRVQITEGEKR